MGLTLALALVATLVASGAMGTDRLQTRDRDTLQTCDPLKTQDCDLTPATSIGCARSCKTARGTACPPIAPAINSRTRPGTNCVTAIVTARRDRTQLQTRDGQPTWEDFLNSATGDGRLGVRREAVYQGRPPGLLFSASLKEPKNGR